MSDSPNQTAPDADHEPEALGPPSSAEIAAVRSLTADCTALLEDYGEQNFAVPLWQHPDTRTASPLEHVLYILELFHAATTRIQRLVSDARPIHVTLAKSEPLAGYNRWTTGALAHQVNTEAAQLVRSAGNATNAEQLSDEARAGVATIISGLLHDICEDGRTHLGPMKKQLGRKEKAATDA